MFPPVFFPREVHLPTFAPRLTEKHARVLNHGAGQGGFLKACVNLGEEDPSDSWEALRGAEMKKLQREAKVKSG